MKKLVLIYVLLIISLLTNVSAISIDLQETYQPGQTMLISIQGNFLTPLKDKQIFFYQGRIQIPLVYNLGKIQDKYYIYALLPNEEKNLTLLIQDAHYLEAGAEYKQDITRNFSVSGSLVDFSVSPGFIITNQDFDIRVYSKAKAVTIKTSFLDNEQEVYVPDSTSKKLEFSIQDVKNSTLTELTISNGISYKIPVYIISSADDTENQTIDNELILQELKFNPKSRDLVVLVNEQRELKINLLNLGNQNLKNIEFDIPTIFENIVTIEPEKPSLDQDESREITLAITPARAGLFSGIIEAKAENVSALFNLTLSVITNLSNNATQNKEYCAYLGGSICNYLTQECSGEIKASLDGNCCIGLCEQKKPSSNWIWVIIIILILFGIVFFLFKRYKKPGKSASQLLKEKQERAEQRFTSSQQEVKGKLGRM